jgi:hypothetical protein
MVREAQGQPPDELLPSTVQKLTRAAACQSWGDSPPDILGRNLVSWTGTLSKIARRSVMPTLLEIFHDARQGLVPEPGGRTLLLGDHAGASTNRLLKTS